MKKLIINNRIGILLFIAIILMISSAILSRPLSNLDEVWNYNIAKNIADEKIPYKDISLVQMPGFFMLVSIFLKFSNEMIITRILAILLNLAILISSYILLKKLKVNKYIRAFAMLVITYIFLEYFCLDYNFFNLFIAMVLMLIEYENLDNDSKKYNFLIGIFAGISIIIKQTTGIFIVAALLLFKLLQLQRNNIKNIFKLSIIRGFGALVPILVLVIYLSFNNIWKNFIDYTILGIFTFDNKVSYLKLLSSTTFYIRVLAIIMPAYFVGMAIWGVAKKNKIVLMFLLYGLASFVVVYPIADNIHFLIGSYPSIIGMIYLAYIGIIKIKEKLTNKKLVSFAKYMTKAMVLIAVCLIIILETYKLITIFKKICTYKDLEHFKCIEVSEGLLNQINIIEDFIKKADKPVYMLDAAAAVYMIPLDRYNKDYDMFLKGNLGGSGEERSN